MFPLLTHSVSLAVIAMGLAVAIALDLAPLSGTSRALPMPDLLLCLVIAVRLRKPGLMPVGLVFVAGLLRDLLSGGAVGPTALVMAVVADRLRSSKAPSRTLGAAFEILAAALAAAACLLAPTLVMWLTFSEAPGWSALSARWVATLLVYPVVAILLPLRREDPRRLADDARLSV